MLNNIYHSSLLYFVMETKGSILLCCNAASFINIYVQVFEIFKIAQ